MGCWLGKFYFYSVKIHEKYISRCIDIAQNGLGTTAPNPMVGAVIVHDEKIIGEGFTSPYGGPHAEVNAIASVREKSLLKEATLYVTLEPCSHFGKTPPCVDLIIISQIPKVVVGILDPHEKVAGKGIARLKDAGCEIVVGVLESECRELHKRFLSFHEKKRPYIILKWAETLDGFIAPDNEQRSENPEPFWITNSRSRQLVHQWRAEENAILVGTNTVLSDNPRLDVRKWKGEHPLRIVIDKDLKIPHDFHALDGSIPTFVLTGLEEASKHKDGVFYEVLDFSRDLAEQIVNVLFKNNCTSVIIEGGTRTLQTFIDAQLWDEARVFMGNTRFQKGLKAPYLKGEIISTKEIEGDLLKIYRP